VTVAVNPAAWPTATIGLLRHLPARTPGKARLARALLRSIRGTQGLIVESSAGARFVVPHLSEPIAFHLLVDGCYEPETAAAILACLSPGDVFVDVGANIGLLVV
jgi:hypothetical protein